MKRTASETYVLHPNKRCKNDSNASPHFSPWGVNPSMSATGTVNPIRAIVDRLNLKDVPKNKKLISLSIGDPTKCGNLPVPSVAKKAVIASVAGGDNNGYVPSHGTMEARKAIASKYSTSKQTYSANDVVIASGCSDAINLAMCSLLDAGDNVLLPRPGFSLYTTVCGRYGFQVRLYNLRADKQWEADLEHLESLIDERTKAILVNNPSNPCGSVYSKEHLQNICRIAYKHHLPILADEIYANMVFEGETFYSCRELTNGPVYVLGGLAKQYLAPGWRVGWILIHDPENKLKKVRGPLINLSQVILGANSICQGAIPAILENTPKSHYSGLNRTLSIAADILYNGFSAIPQLNPVKPQGAMYLMVEILINKLEEIEDDVAFCQGLLKEEGLSVLPGVIFGSPNFFRVVLCPPPEQLRIALQRISDFCSNHKKVS